MTKLHRAFPIFLSLGFALLLMIIPLPIRWQWFRPEWLTLFLVYWVFRDPEWVGVMTAWFVGLIMDILGGVLLGQYALAMAVVVYFAHLLRHRLRLFPSWQQAFAVLILVGFGQLILVTVQWLIGRPPKTILYWGSTVTSVLLWPWFYRFMRYYEHKAVG
jgi:rod shape-determining protein MreD